MRHLVSPAHSVPHVEPFPSRNHEEWKVYLLTEQPATATANKFLSHETGTREEPLESLYLHIWYSLVCATPLFQSTLQGSCTKMGC